jgi:hypothetical protein
VEYGDTRVRRNAGSTTWVLSTTYSIRTNYYSLCMIRSGTTCLSAAGVVRNTTDVLVVTTIVPVRGMVVSSTEYPALRTISMEG